MAARAPHGTNQPPKIIVKKIYIEGHGGHHGGAWKVAYADFVTAMMAFFLLMWLLGATTEAQRKALADYFAPTLIELKQKSAGSYGPFGGSSLTDVDNYPHRAGQTGTRALTVPAGAEGGPQVGTGEKGTLKDQAALNAQDRRNFSKLRQQLEQRMKANGSLAKLGKHVRFVETSEGLRIDLVDNADYSMFDLGTTALVGEADQLIGEIAASIGTMENAIMIRGHTDSLGYGNPLDMNNWMLSSGRAEATRRRLAAGGLPDARFERIEGVADREPMVAKDPTDPRNRRVAITLLYRKGEPGGRGGGMTRLASR
ncbi:OmpA family protein [Sphingomonas sp. S1-29]|uniref:flagellar motor protein MotB n=1 Tax=Sphingomonas sp. S1-29 TaxID=2991074 RepID=UPI002240B7AF|nr:flagellar motor protein MotB [Sphingomonas sp. S1-29]UZK68908.1 OmpA family protein [Sphingomonas sp. S1-29]